jgi:uncharacterized membrane protein YfcA
MDLFSAYHFELHQWIFAVMAALCLGMSKTGFTGMSMLGVALMAEVWPARESTGVILPMLIFGDFFAVMLFSRHALWPEVWRVLPPAVLGVVIGFGIFRLLPGTIFGPVIGWIILVLVCLQLWQRSEAASRPLAELSGETVTSVNGDQDRGNLRQTSLRWSLGALTGITTMLANAAGPVMTVYLLMMRLAKYEFVGTSAWFYCIINLTKLPFSYSLGVINLSSLGFNLILLPAVAAGALAGRWLLKLVPQLWFERILLASSALAAVRLIWH